MKNSLADFVPSFIPSPPINSFQIGPLTIRIYALCILAGVCLAAFLLLRLVKRFSPALLDFETLLEMLCWVLPISIIGARLFHCITVPDTYFSSPAALINILKIWEGGLGIMGGVAFGVITAFVFCRKKDIEFVSLLDLVSACLLVAQAVGRFGNYFNRELYGFPTTLPWGLQVDSSGVAYHPTFLYEALWNLLGAFLIYKLIKSYYSSSKSTLIPGSIFNIYIIWYTFGRIFIELVRIDYSYQFFSFWRVNSFIAFVICIIAAAVFIIRMMLRKNSRTVRRFLRYKKSKTVY
ncbi:MAG: prolipoprotein diacylglyceryl transferase [Bifidobacteriaceae bacterium]|nr:prolipoprotein diacylglyceryl transferase [Bifidobacteriaceae bacterium]